MDRPAHPSHGYHPSQQQTGYRSDQNAPAYPPQPMTSYAPAYPPQSHYPPQQQVPYKASYGTQPSYTPLGSRFFCVKLRGLPFTTTEQDVALFLGFQPVDTVLNNREGRFSGEAFVVMGQSHDYEIAMSRNKAYLGNRYIEVFQARKEDYYNAIVNGHGTTTNSGGGGGAQKGHLSAPGGSHRGSHRGRGRGRGGLHKNHHDQHRPDVQNRREGPGSYNGRQKPAGRERSRSPLPSKRREGGEGAHVVQPQGDM